MLEQFKLNEQESRLVILSRKDSFIWLRGCVGETNILCESKNNRVHIKLVGEHKMYFEVAITDVDFEGDLTTINNYWTMSVNELADTFEEIKIRLYDELSDFSRVVEHDEDGWYAHTPDLVGCHSDGSRFEEAIINLNDAIELHIEENKEDEQKNSTNTLQDDLRVELEKCYSNSDYDNGRLLIIEQQIKDLVGLLLKDYKLEYTIDEQYDYESRKWCFDQDWTISKITKEDANKIDIIIAKTPLYISENYNNESIRVSLSTIYNSTEK
jgi:predicted RNase H-like HicB family nuclease